MKIVATFNMLSENALNFVRSKNLLFGKVLTLSSKYTHFNTLKKKAVGKHCGKR